MNIPLKVLGIYREEKFSNRAINADKSIMDSVLGALKDKVGSDVAIIIVRGEDLVNCTFDSDFDLIFSMAQEENVLQLLDFYEKNGAVVVNSARGIRNCFRYKLSELLQDKEFSYPRYIKLKVHPHLYNYYNTFYSENGYWVKRGDFHALADEDVVHISSISELPSVLELFEKRGVEEVILQENCEGELFKFYGVRDQYFNLRYMGKTGKSRYQFYAGESEIDFDPKYLEVLAHKAANILELDYFGGDCIVTQNGGMHFIDINDWPSFRTCLLDVAPHMVSYALRKLNSEIIYDNCIN
jgi:glutathione synthase/RimK-type ligase-like ATP-grasp enzyme